MKRRSLQIVLLCFGLLAGILFGVSSFADAHNEREKYYESICIEEGDSLWSIAGEHYSSDFGSFSAYLDEVCQINHLSRDAMIHQDCYLVIPYYD